ncbi:MAG: 6-pyruvoyl-tetrahydropterin synthase-related protein [Candidatus Aenigmatarchaeota archaeon]
MKLELGDLVPLAAIVVFFAAFGVNAAGMAIALLPGFLFSYFLIECRKTVRILLSIPLTILLVLVPTWALNIFSFPVNGPVLVFISVAYSAVFAALLKKSKVKIGLKSVIGIDTALLIVLAASAVLITYPLHSGLLPRTDGSSHYYKIWQITESLNNANQIPFWDSGWYAGYPLFDFYPPMSHYVTAFMSYFIPADLNIVFDYAMITAYVFLAIGVFVLCRALGLNAFSSFLSGLIAVASPRLSTNAMFSGQFPTIMAFALVPISVYVFIRAFTEKKTGLYLLSGILLGVDFLIHHLTGYFLGILFLVSFLTLALKRGADVLGFLKITLSAALIVAFWLVPFFINMPFSDYSKKTVLGFNPDVFLALTESPDKACSDFYCFEAMGLELTLLALVGGLVWLSGLAIGKGKLYISPRMELGSVFTVSMFLGVLVLALAPFIGITNYIPFGSSFGSERFTFYLMLPIAILGGAIAEIANGFKNKEFVVAGIVVSLVVAVFLWRYIDLVNFRAADWNTETAPLSSSGLSDLYSELRSLPAGRVITYGIFQGAIVAAIPVQTGKGAISGWQPQSSPNYKRVAGKLEDISGQSLFNFNVSSRSVYSIYQQSWTKWIAINLCSNEGANAVNSTFIKDERYLFAWRNGNNQGCLVILETPNTEFAESIKPIGVVNDAQSIKDSIYDTENGYNVYFTRRVSDIPINDYKLVINKDVIWDESLANDIASIASSEPKPLTWQRNENGITISNTTGWTLIKETYYPLWSAYNNNKKLKIYESDLGFMLVNSTGDLQLKIEKPVYYLASAAITLAFFILILFFTLSGKPASHNPDKEPDAVLNRP